MANRPDDFDATTPNPAPEPAAPEDSAGGAIFSSDDTRVETENLPEISAVAPQAPMSAISPALRTESTITGDLKLGDNQKKKKWPIVLLVAVAVIVVGIGIWAIIGNSNLNIFTHEEKVVYGITDESRRLFNRYANFLLGDDDSDEKPDLLNFLANEYTFLQPEAMFAERIKSEGLETARSYFNDLNMFYNQFSQAFFPPESDTGDAPENNDTGEYSRNDLPNYFYEAARGSYLNIGEIISLYIQNGEESLRNTLETIFKSDSKDEAVQSLLEARKKQMELYLNAMIQADQSGCIVNGSLNADCARPKFMAIEQEALKLMATTNTLEIELREKAITTLENIYYAFYPDDIVIEEYTVR